MKAGSPGRRGAPRVGEEVPLLGLDIGSVNVKGVLLYGGGSPDQSTWCRPAQGRPMEVVTGILREALSVRDGRGGIKMAVTGAGKVLLASQGGAEPVNEVVAVARAVASVHPEVRTIIDIGGQFTKWILVSPPSACLGDPGSVEDFALNGLCAAGSGAFLEQQAGRLRLSLDELGRLAAGARRGATIAGRCSVFAKSDMIHLQQRGTPMEEIAYGLCLALGRTFVATVLKGRRVEPPVALVGGGAANRGLVRAFGEVLGLGRDDIIVPADHLTAGARGAALGSRSSRSRAVQVVLGELERRAEDASGANDRTLSPSRGDLAPLRPPPGEGEPALPETPSLADLGLATGPVRGYLGVDVGSVSTNVVVMDEEQRLLHGIYLPTRGAPVQVLDEALAALGTVFGDRLEVLGVGTTGSGRYLAEQLLGADLVKNEITAQLVSAAHYVPEVDTIFEIGGQDSKYIDVQGGRLRDFEMNKICAAGTGSFLEEQAERLGVQIRGEFAEHALGSDRPRDLGTRCTVFMDAELVRAQAEGVPVPDLCSGLAYSVARNYLDKVVAGRRVGRTVVFQGGTASNAAVVAAFNELLGRALVVHPYNRISGAIGMALLSEREMRRRGRASTFRGLAACRDHSVRTFECQGCENRCQVSRVEAGGRVAHFGDVCEKYTAKDRAGLGRASMRSAARDSAPLAAQVGSVVSLGTEARPAETSIEVARSTPSLAEGSDLFARRAALLEAHLPRPRPEGRPRLGVVQASVGLELLPLFAHLLDQLGFEPVLSGATTAKHLARGAEGLPPEVCLPLKVAHGHLRELLFDRGLERVFLPTVLEFPRAHRGDRPFACLFAQELPDMAAIGAAGRVLTPQLVLGGAAPATMETAWELARCLEVDVDAAERALVFAVARQRGFERARREEGRRFLGGALPGARAVVVLGKPYNLHDPFANLNLARHLGRLGFTAIPMDMVPTASLTDRWYQVPWHFNREQVRALQVLDGRRSIFPLLVSNFGCGPDAFASKHLERMLGDRPRLFLEFDEHRGEAGLITRLEAFADEVEEFLAEGRAEPLRRRVTRHTPHRSRHRVERVFVPCFEGHSHVFAGLLRAEGFEVEVLQPPDEETARLGEEVTSGRECHPYALLAGEMVRLARSGRVRPGDAFFTPGTRLPCLLPQYGDGFRMVRDQLGSSLEIWDPHVKEMQLFFGLHGVGCVYGGLTVVDHLIVTACQRRPFEVVSGSVDRAIERCYKDVEDTLARRRDRGFRVVDELTECVRRCMERLHRVPLRTASPRPIVGVTGDLYTRVNAAGNGDLFARMEALGCTVWPSPFFGGTADFEAPQNARRKAARGEALEVMQDYALGLLQLGFRESLLGALDPDLRPFCEEPPSNELQAAAQAYFGADTNHLVRGIVGKMVHFARSGAHGVISAAGLGCMVGVAASATVHAIREAHDGLPVVALFYGSHEGPSQRIGLETFVHQVHERFRRCTLAD